MVPNDRQRPAIREGSDVLDVTGEKIGEVVEMTIDPEGGEIKRLVVRSGHIFHHDTEVPGSWVKDMTVEGVMLTKSKEEIEAHPSE